jgi:pimeloyl-ACP methyl ester carboxylesterase
MTQNHYTTGEAMLNGVPFAYEITGEGHPLVFVHAGIADQRMWNEQAAAFADRFQVIRYDLRGYGKTPMTAGPFYTHQDLYDLLKFLGIEKTYLIGCSMGGTTIINFALEHPEMVDALVVTCSTPSGYEFREDETAEPDDKAAKLQQEYDNAMERGDVRRAAELEVDFWLIGLRRTADSVDPALRTRLYEMNEIALKNKVGIEDEEQPLDPPAINRLSEIRVPTLIIIGDLDDPNIVQGSGLLAAQIPSAQKAVFNGTAHFPNMERPAEYNRIVLEFLTNLNS